MSGPDAERASAASQSHCELESILDSLADGVCAFNAEGQPTFWNAAAEAMIGLAPDSGWPNHRTADAVLAPVRRCMQSGSGLTDSVMIVDSDGGPSPLAVTCTPTRDGERLTGVVVALRHEAERLGTRGQSTHYSGGTPRSLAQLELAEDLRNAIADETIDVFFQPMVNATDGVAVEAEALVRWHHPRRGLISPAEFIPIAEETGLVLPLGRLVLREACRQCKSWETEHGVTIGVSVNLSPLQFEDGELVDQVLLALEGADLPAGRLCLEITETLAMRDDAGTTSTLQRLKAIGVRVAIDDFGTGHSSLNYLKRFPIDIVKIDGSFVNEITTSTVDNAIVTAVVTLARSLGIVTVAECVEDPEQLGELRELGCTLIQGFLFAKPMPSSELREWIAAEAKSRGLRIPRPRRPESQLPVPTA